jgi:cytochrome b561
MELNSIEDVKALTEYQKIEQIERIEKKIHRLSHIPTYLCLVLMIYGGWAMWSEEHTLLPVSIILIATTITSVGQSNVQRTDLLKKLFELKYGK